MYPAAILVLGEYLLFQEFVPGALWSFLLAVLGCLLGAIHRPDRSTVLAALALLPVFRLVNLATPIFVDRTLVFLPIVYLPLLPAVYAVVRSTDIRVGFRPRWFALLLLPAISVGAALGSAFYAHVESEALVSTLAMEHLLTLAAVQLLVVALVEELLFRGTLQRGLIDETGRIGAVVLTSGLYGAMHSVYGSTTVVWSAIGVGLLLGTVYEVTDSIGLVIVIHGVMNVFLFGVVPLHAPVWELV